MLKHVFLSVPLVSLSHNIPAAEALHILYRQLAEVCRQHNLEVYEPYEYSDPTRHEFIPAVDVYEMNYANVTSSDLLIAYIGVVSAGVAMEIAFAKCNNVPIVVVYEASKQPELSRMLIGCRALEITAENTSGLPNAFEKHFNGILATLGTETINTDDDLQQFHNLLKTAHESSGLNNNQVATRSGLDRAYVGRIIEGAIKKPKRNQILRLCAWGWRLSIEETNQILKTAKYEPL